VYRRLAASRKAKDDADEGRITMITLRLVVEKPGSQRRDMNQLRLWLETYVPAVFQHREKSEQIDIAGVNLTLRDWEGSTVLAIVPKEILDDEYGLAEIEFRPGDVVVDVGANIGIVALYLAKKHPDITIKAIEPVPTTYRHLVENIELNNVHNITPLNCAITNDGRDLRMIVNPAHSGGSTGH
jgi:hypothetical protein